MYYNIKYKIKYYFYNKRSNIKWASLVLLDPIIRYKINQSGPTIRKDTKTPILLTSICT